MKSNKKFITVEGIDGAGKSTTISMIKEFLESKGEQVLLTREPGGSKLGEKLRDISKTNEMCPLTETLLMFTARAEHIEQKIKPALDSEMWVICDRFTDSTEAYQCYGKGVPESKVRALENLVQDDIKPSLTIILDLPIAVARKRALVRQKQEKINNTNNNNSKDRFEEENDKFFEKVANGYKEIFKRDPNRCQIVDSSLTENYTKEQINNILESFYKNFLNNNPSARQMKFNF